MTNPDEGSLELVEKVAFMQLESLKNLLGPPSDADVRWAAQRIARDLTATPLVKLREALEEEISAWAFAHGIDGSIRNDLFRRIKERLAALSSNLDPSGEE